MAELDKDQVLNWLGERTVLEISGIVKELEEKWGVSAAAPMAVAAPSAAGADGEEAKVEEKTEFDVILTAFGENKIAAIKEVRAIT